MPRLFGTDGARGVANSELTCELAMKIGRAAAVVLAGAGKAALKYSSDRIREFPLKCSKRR